MSLGTYDPERSSSRTSEASFRLVTWTLPQASLFGDLPSERFSETWPTCGMTRRGRSFALPMSGPAIGGLGSSSLLPTPAAEKITPQRREDFTPNLPGRVNMLHTPTTGDTHPTYDHRASPGYVRNKPVPNLAAQVDELLPTPTADHSRGLAQTGTDYQSLPNTVLSLGDLTNQPSDDGNEP